MIPFAANACDKPSNCSSRQPTSTRPSSTTWYPSQFQSVALANCSGSAAPATPLSAAAPSLPSCWITRHGWIVQSPCGSYLDPNGAMTVRPDLAWLCLLPGTAAARLQQLGITGLDRWRLVPVALVADPADPRRRWRIHNR